MRIHFAALATFCFLAFAAPSEPAETFESSAKTYFPAFADEMERAHALLKMPITKHNPQSLMEALYAAEKAYRLGRATGNQEEIKTGLALYDLFLAENTRLSKDSASLITSFHVALSWGRITYILNEDGLLTGERREKVLALASAAMQLFAGTPTSQADVALCDCNIAMGSLLASSAAAAAFPDDPNAPSTRKKLAAILDLHLAQGDMREESSNYEPLLIGLYIDLLRQEHRLDDLRKNPQLRRMIQRWRDYVSPAVFYPETGDDYFNHEKINFGLINCLEQAARIYDDPSLAAEAHRLMLRYRPGRSAGERILATALLELPSYRFPQTLAPLSTVYQRAVGVEAPVELWSSLVLRTGLKPGDAMIMMDLYSEGSHAHPARRPAIAYYEAGGTPLYHNLGRRAVLGGNCGNVFWTDEEFDAFPGLCPANVWNTQIVPLQQLNLVTSNGESTISGPTWLRFWKAKQEQTTLTFANMRLEGPGGTKVIDDFSDRLRWVNFERKSSFADHPEWIQDETDPIKGTTQKLAWGLLTRKGNENLCRNLGGKANSFRFKAGDYDCVKFDFKYEGDFPYANLRGWLGGVDLGFAALPCTVTDAKIKQLGADAWGRVDFTAYRGTGNGLSRRMLLTSEGVLVVVDRYTPGPQGAHQTVGQLWQLYTMAEKGDDWFASASDGTFPQIDDAARPERRVLVKYSRAPGTSCGAGETTPSNLNAYRILQGKKAPYKTFWTTYSKTKLQGDGKPFTAVQVVYPLLKDSDSAKIAAAIQFTEVGDGTAKLRLPTDTTATVEVAVDEEGASALRSEFGHPNKGLLRTGDPRTVRQSAEP